MSDFLSQMLSIFEHTNDYGQRKVDRYDDPSKRIMISTAEVHDSTDPYETCIRHPYYNEGDHIVVETYSEREEAQLGHKRWVEKLTSQDELLPEQLEDVSTCFFGELSRGLHPTSLVFKKVIPTK